MPPTSAFQQLRFAAAAPAFFLLFAFLPVLPVRTYDYDEIRRLNATCTPKDTCSLPRDLDNLDKHNCDCSGLCALYGSCCIDSPALNFSGGGGKHEKRASCLPAGPSGDSVYMIDSCPPDYRGPAAVRRRCEQTAKNWSDPFNNVPVTNPRSLRTYKSLFCGACNGEVAGDLVMWQLGLDCSSFNDSNAICRENRDFVLNNMMYVREKGVWGLWFMDSKTDWKFHTLPMSYQKPHHLEKVLTQCRPNLVSKCDPRWRGGEKTRRLCEAYMGVVYLDDVGFRNVHCALCNGVTDLSKMQCNNSTAAFRAPATHSFGILLDINLKDGNKVGSVDVKCEEGQVYDPFSKKCRTIECALPGHSLKDGKCFPD